MTHATSLEDGPLAGGYPVQAPPRAGISLGDTLAAQSAFQAIVLALYARGASGRVVDAASTDACFAVVGAPVYSVADIDDDPYFRERELLRMRQPARWEVGADAAEVLGDLSEEVEGFDLPRREGVA